MNRRSFIRSLFAGAVGVAASELIDVERLLWVPGEKTIFLPSVEVFSGDTFITPEWVMKDVAKHFLSNIKLVGHFNRPWSEPFGPGARVTVRLPRKQEGPSLSLGEPSIWSPA